MPFFIDGPALRRIREKRLLTIADLAKCSGVSEKAIWYNETGMSHKPDPRTIKKIAKALKLPAADFTVWVE